MVPVVGRVVVVVEVMVEVEVIGASSHSLSVDAVAVSSPPASTLPVVEHSVCGLHRVMLLCLYVPLAQAAHARSMAGCGPSGILGQYI